MAIAPTGIGSARLGMSFRELKASLPQGTSWETRSPFISDFDAIAVSNEGEVQYYILYLAGQPFTDTDIIQGLFTDNSAYRTAEGIGPGVSIQDAEAAYGDATLSYNTENESREYVRFANQPASNLSFGTGNVSQGTAGTYPNPIQGYNETQEFKPEAMIKSVLVVCLTEDCARAE